MVQAAAINSAIGYSKTTEAFQKTTEKVFIAHYAKAYDYFLIRVYLRHNKLFIKPLKWSEFHVTFLDSHSFRPMALSGWLSWKRGTSLTTSTLLQTRTTMDHCLTLNTTVAIPCLWGTTQPSQNGMEKSRQSMLLTQATASFYSRSWHPTATLMFKFLKKPALL